MKAAKWSPRYDGPGVVRGIHSPRPTSGGVWGVWRIAGLPPIPFVLFPVWERRRPGVWMSDRPIPPRSGNVPWKPFAGEGRSGLRPYVSPLTRCRGCGALGDAYQCGACARGAKPFTYPTAPPRNRRTPAEQIRRGPRWRALSARLRKTIGACQDCGSQNDLTVDHVIPISDRPDLAYTLSNLRVLCRPCHGRKTLKERSARHVTRKQ